MQQYQTSILGKGQSAKWKVFSFGQNCLTGNDGTQSWSSCAARNCTISRRCPAFRLRRTLARVGNPREEPTASPTDSGLRFGYHRATRTVQGYAQRNQSGSSDLPGASANSRDYRVKGPILTQYAGYDRNHIWQDERKSSDVIVQTLVSHEISGFRFRLSRIDWAILSKFCGAGMERSRPSIGRNTPGTECYYA